MTSIITREADLRLGLAARELGRVGVAAFAEAVGERLGLPLTETRLATLTVSDLREILAGSHADEDCKVGVDAATLKQLFQPFFTTKATGKGTGLGLFMVRNILQQHQGWVEVESTVGQGTAFHLFLPLGGVAAEREVA